MEDFFSKTNYTDGDIISIIESATEESIHLDFKANGSLDNQIEKKKEISKDVSSFANSDGGIIIYGVSEVDHVANSLSFVNGNNFTKEWLEQVINSRIQPRIQGLLISPIRFDDDIEKTVYIVKIPKSPNAPHMASDNKFYKRFNFQSVAMEEYEIRDIYNRKHLTKLKISNLLHNQGGSQSIDGRLNHVDSMLRFQVKNTGNAIEELYKLEIYIPKDFYLNYHNANPIRPFLIREEPNQMVFSVPNKSPLFQGEETTIAEAGIKVSTRTLHLLREPGIKIKLYYCNGFEEKIFDLNSILTYGGILLNEHDWG